MGIPEHATCDLCRWSIYAPDWMVAPGEAPPLFCAYAPPVVMYHGSGGHETVRPQVDPSDYCAKWEEGG